MKNKNEKETPVRARLKKKYDKKFDKMECKNLLNSNALRELNEAEIETENIINKTKLAVGDLLNELNTFHTMVPTSDWEISAELKISNVWKKYFTICNDIFKCISEKDQENLHLMIEYGANILTNRYSIEVFTKNPQKISNILFELNEKFEKILKISPPNKLPLLKKSLDYFYTNAVVVYRYILPNAIYKLLLLYYEKFYKEYFNHLAESNYEAVFNLSDEEYLEKLNEIKKNQVAPKSQHQSFEFNESVSMINLDADMRKKISQYLENIAELKHEKSEINKEEKLDLNSSKLEMMSYFYRLLLIDNSEEIFDLCPIAIDFFQKKLISMVQEKKITGQKEIVKILLCAKSWPASRMFYLKNYVKAAYYYQILAEEVTTLKRYISSQVFSEENEKSIIILNNCEDFLKVQQNLCNIFERLKINRISSKEKPISCSDISTSSPQKEDRDESVEASESQLSIEEQKKLARRVLIIPSKIKKEKEEKNSNSESIENLKELPIVSEFESAFRATTKKTSSLPKLVTGKKKKKKNKSKKVSNKCKSKSDGARKVNLPTKSSVIELENLLPLHTWTESTNSGAGWEIAGKKKNRKTKNSRPSSHATLSSLPKIASKPPDLLLTTASLRSKMQSRGQLVKPVTHESLLKLPLVKPLTSEVLTKPIASKDGIPSSGKPLKSESLITPIPSHDHPKHKKEFYKQKPLIYGSDSETSTLVKGDSEDEDGYTNSEWDPYEELEQESSGIFPSSISSSVSCISSSSISSVSLPVVKKEKVRPKITGFQNPKEIINRAPGIIKREDKSEYKEKKINVDEPKNEKPPVLRQAMDQNERYNDFTEEEKITHNLFYYNSVVRGLVVNKFLSLVNNYSHLGFLTYVQFNDRALIHLAYLLMFKSDFKSFEELNLSHNTLSEQAMSILGTMLSKEHIKLTTLILNSSGMTNESIARLAATLKKDLTLYTHSIVVLSMTDTPSLIFTSTLVENLCQIIRNNPMLIEINLDNRLFNTTLFEVLNSNRRAFSQKIYTSIDNNDRWALEKLYHLVSIIIVLFPPLEPQFERPNPFHYAVINGKKECALGLLQIIDPTTSQHWQIIKSKEENIKEYFTCIGENKIDSDQFQKANNVLNFLEKVVINRSVPPSVILTYPPGLIVLPPDEVKAAEAPGPIGLSLPSGGYSPRLFNSAGSSIAPKKKSKCSNKKHNGTRPTCS